MARVDVIRWLHGAVTQRVEIAREHGDPETFRATNPNMRYEAYWAGLMYRLTVSRMWLHHAWQTADRR